MASIRVERRDDGVAVVLFDRPGKKVNTLSPEVLDEVREAVVPLLDDAAVRALVVGSAKPEGFIAGADLDVVPGLDRAAATALSREGNRVLELVASASKPVVAAVHGAALGGGFEVALACHFILASDHPATVLGLPEVMLGLLPGGGGTQRLVRRVGLVAALPLLLTGAKVRVRKARRLGLVDGVTTPGGIVDTACRAALLLADGKLARRRPGRLQRLLMAAPLRSLILGQARQQVRARTRGLYPAPAAILDCVETGLKRGLKAGLERESERFGELVVSPESHSLVWLFQAMTATKKAPDEDLARPVRRLAVLGAGFMGAGVASVAVANGPVVVRDVSTASLAAAAKGLDQGLAKQQRSGAITRRDVARRRSALHLTTDLAAVADADLVVEAVFEDLALKRRVLAEVEALVGEEVVIASNTSALPIAAIAAELAHPERVLGMHYFSPVPKMPLLEIVAAEATAPWAVATARAVGAAQGKTCIVVRDGPGFYTTRILAPYLNEAVLVLEEGARVEDLDRAMKDVGFPVGPVALIDEVGLDVGAHVAESLGAAFAERGMSSSPSLPRLVAAGLSGRKGRRGFYRYPATGRKQPNEEVYALLGGAPRQALDAAAVARRLTLMMVNEAARCLEEGVIESPTDGDLGAILGLGFPPFRGGPFHFVDGEGAAALVAELEALAERHGPRFAPAGILVEQAGSGSRFHPR